MNQVPDMPISWVSTDKCKVLIVDQSVVLRRLLRSWLDSVPQVETVAEADSSREALRTATELQPHLILLDNGVAGLDVPAFMRTIRAELPATRVVILSTYDVDVYRDVAMASGAIEFVPKADLIDRLVAMLRSH